MRKCDQSFEFVSSTWISIDPVDRISVKCVFKIGEVSEIGDRLTYDLNSLHFHFDIFQMRLLVLSRSDQRLTLFLDRLLLFGIRLVQLLFDLLAFDGLCARQGGQRGEFGLVPVSRG